MKKLDIITLILCINLMILPVFAGETNTDTSNLKNIKATKKIDKEVEKSFEKKAKTTLPKNQNKKVNSIFKKASSENKVLEEQENLSADAMVLYNTNDIDGALKILESIPKENRTALDYLLLGNIYQDKKDTDNAAIMYQNSIQKDKTFYRAYYNLGNLYLDDENAIEAIKLYKQSLKYKYDFAYANYNLGCAYVKLGELNKAKSAFLRAISNKKDMTNAYYNLAFVYKKLGNNKKAEQYLKIYNELILR